MHFAPVEALRLAAEDDARRWARATGCDIAVDESGIHIELEAPILRPDGSDAPGKTSETRDRIAINARSRASQQRDALLHEMGHALGGDHVPGAGVLSGEKRHSYVIDAAALESVCARLPCLAFNPE